MVLEALRRHAASGILPLPMANDLDIQGILAKSVSPTTVEDLRKQGLKNVLVLNKDSVKNLISQAVEAAIERRSRDRVAEEARASAEKARIQVAESIQEREQALANQALLVADRTRLERELSSLKDDLTQRTTVLEEEKRKLVEASKAELDKLLASTKQDASKLPELQAQATRLAAETQDLRQRLEAAEKARTEAAAALEAERRRAQETASGTRGELDAARSALERAETERRRAQETVSGTRGELDAARSALERAEADRRRLEAAAAATSGEAQALQARIESAEKSRAEFHSEFEEFRDEISKQLSTLAGQKTGPDTGEMETLLTRFKAGLALELTQTLGTGGRMAEPEGIGKVVNDVAARNVARAFEENVSSNLNTVTPETRRSGVGDKLERIRQRLSDSRKTDGNENPNGNKG